jgi:hypothetical protein
MADASGMHGCQMHDQGGHAATSGHQCGTSGCDMCGTCTAALPQPLTLAMRHDRLLPEAGEDLHPPSSDIPTPYRPPIS